MTRRLLSVLTVVAAVIVLSAPASWGQDGTPPTSAARRHLPGTTLEADQRDDGNTSAAPWFIGSGVAAIVMVGAGGWLLQRRIEHSTPARPVVRPGPGSEQPR
jgi:hypothetical protein